MAVFKKQIKDTFKNKTVLIQFLLFPILALIMENSISSQEIPKGYFVILFSTMYIGMAPMTSMAAIISEEKEKNTLRVLMMANVKPTEYLIGVGSYIFIACTLGAVAFGLIGGYEGYGLLRFILSMMAGIIASSLVGAIVGMFSKNQISATSISIPTMVVFSFLPMISMFNSTIEKASKILFTQQISYLVNDISVTNFTTDKFAIISANMIIFIVVFIYAYKKKGLVIDS